MKGTFCDDIDGMVSSILQSYYPNLTEKEMAVSRQVIITAWDLQTDSACYEEVVCREFHPNTYYIGEDEVNDDPPIFSSEEEVKEIISRLIAKEILEDKEVEFVYGDKSTRKHRHLTYVRKELNEQMQGTREKLGMEY